MTKLTNKPSHPHTIEFVKNRANATKRNKNRKIYFYEVVDSLATTEEIFNKANQDYFIKRSCVRHFHQAQQRRVFADLFAEAFVEHN